MTITCDRCKKELTEPGALVFSPPRRNYGGEPQPMLVDKHHLCVRCWDRLWESISEE